MSHAVCFSVRSCATPLGTSRRGTLYDVQKYAENGRISGESRIEIVMIEIAPLSKIAQKIGIVFFLRPFKESTAIDSRDDPRH